MKKNIAVFFGGKSVEHDISIITGQQVLRNLDRDMYHVYPIYIDKNGAFHSASNLEEISIYSNFDKLKIGDREVAFIPPKPFLEFRGRYKRVLNKIDCAIVCNHGVNGEDGTLQGLLELCNIPFTSSSVLASAISMDKIIMKDIFLANKIPSCSYTYLHRGHYEISEEDCIEKITDILEFPLIVKPSNLGSSIGIKTCENIEDLHDALEVAFMYDERVLVEKLVENMVEINCAVIGTSYMNEVSEVEYPQRGDEILSFEDKYIEKRAKAQKTLGKKIEDNVKLLSKKVYEIFNCKGVVRIDFMYDTINKKLYVNELNSIPGSLAFYLFAPVSMEFLLDELIECAENAYEEKNKNVYAYKSSALDIFSKITDLNKYLKGRK